MAAIIDGRALSRALSDETAGTVAGLRQRHGIVPGLAWPGLAVVLVGEDPAGQVSVARKIADVAFDEIGHARAATPVPGGVGPMTIACPLANTVRAARIALHG